MLTEEQKEKQRKYRQEWAKNKRRNDPEWKARVNAKQRSEERRKYHREWISNRRKKDPEWRARSNAYDRVRSAKREKDPEYRAKVNKRKKERRWNDPEYRIKANLYKQEWRQQKKLEKNPNYLASYQREKANAQKRYYEDPERRMRIRLQNRTWRQNKKENDPVYWDYRRKRNTELARLQRQDSVYLELHRARKYKEKQKRRAKDPEGYRIRQNETRRKYLYTPKVKKRITDPILKMKLKEQAKRNRLKRMQDPIYRLHDRELSRAWYRNNPERARQAKMRYRARKRLLKDSNYQRILEQAVLVQLEQLGFPTSVLKGVFQ